MDYIEKLYDGQSLSTVFDSYRRTPYKYLFIVSAGTKDALLHYSDENKAFLSEWYDKIEDFKNFIFTKVYLKKSYNYIYPTGRLVSPFWSDDMKIMGQKIWPLSFNGKYNFIKDDGSLMLDYFADGIWTNENKKNSYIVKSISDDSDIYMFSIDEDGIKRLFDANSYNNKPIVDVYSSLEPLTERLFIHRRLFSISIDNADGQEIVSGLDRIIRFYSRPLSDIEGFSEGYQGLLFSLKKEVLAGKEELVLSYEFVIVQSGSEYKIVSFSTESVILDTFEDIQVGKSLSINVKKNGLWNIIDKYGDYVSKDLWFDSIEVLPNGNAIVTKDGKSNFLKSNGLLLSKDWFDEIRSVGDTNKFAARRGDLFNYYNSNLRLLNPKLQENLDVHLAPPELICAATSPEKKSLSTIQAYDPVWILNNSVIIECYVLTYANNILTILWQNSENSVIEGKEINISYYADSGVETQFGTLYLDRPW